MLVLRWPERLVLPAELRALIAAVLCLVLPLLLWRIFFLAWTDWAVLFLLLLAGVLFWARYSLTFEMHKARAQIALRPGSLLSRWLNGRVQALLYAGFFSIVSVLLLGWLALSENIWLVISYVILGLLSGGFFLVLKRYSSCYFSDPFSMPIACSIAATGAILLVMPLLVWVNYAIIPRPEQASLSQAIAFSQQKLPDRPSLITKFVSALYAIEGVKLLITQQIIEDGKLWWAGLVYSIDAALAGVFLSPAAAHMTAVVDTILHEEATDERRRQDSDTRDGKTEGNHGNAESAI